MKLSEVNRTILDPALRLLIDVAGMPARVDSPEARVELLSIGLQESEFIHRVQMVGNPPRPVGPAHSFWQGERGGGMVHGVRLHRATRAYAAKVYAARNVPAEDDAIWRAIETDDILAAALARLLLWSDPAALPPVGDVVEAFELYARTWRPGAYTRGTAEQRANLRTKWRTYYRLAHLEVTR